MNESLEEVWRKRYYRAVRKFQDQGIETVTNLETGADLYISLRRKWNPNLIKLTNYMGYSWNEIAPYEN
ncbi:MAG: hypothetical protein KME28_23245 [Pelatocladus maniniholoensis HA4357-MV3]|jgi:hypothetical protein|uniref:Uncharacterized protein n=1 Tax=Pelatocladus maniniholoensis HA4357-MV3 TaxID=1117104 RepID=A0A9E3LVM6_9NOST|nr:hypothetical protein [Pelatocladus maniniholoensis HA4357-MV3]BAZ65761.1 hypothetical protein NIES4106_05060 [Fischerella sp. NIES-4106]